MSYSPALTMGVWLGNPDTTPLKNGNSSIPGPIVNKVMAYAHEEVYAKEGKWKQGDWYTMPTGIQKIGNELYPSWYDKSKAQQQTKMSFDKVSKKLATSCTPDGAKIDVSVIKSTDPTTKKPTISASDGYDGTKNDDAHDCNDAKPQIPAIAISGGPGNYQISVAVVQGKASLTGLTINVNGTPVSTQGVSGTGNYTATYNGQSPFTIDATVTDSLFYTASNSKAG